MLSKAKVAERVEQVTGEPAAESEWLTLHQAAHFCNISLGTFRRHIMEHVTCKRLGWRVMVNRGSLRRYYGALPDGSRPRARRRKKDAARG